MEDAEHSLEDSQDSFYSAVIAIVATVGIVCFILLYIVYTSTFNGISALNMVLTSEVVFWILVVTSTAFVLKVLIDTLS